MNSQFRITKVRSLVATFIGLISINIFLGAERICASPAGSASLKTFTVQGWKLSVPEKNSETKLAAADEVAEPQSSRSFWDSAELSSCTQSLVKNGVSYSHRVSIKALKKSESARFWANALVTCNEHTEMYVLLRSNALFTIYINGSKCGELVDSNKTAANDYICRIPLTRGENYIAVKAETDHQNADFECLVYDSLEAILSEAISSRYSVLKSSFIEKNTDLAFDLSTNMADLRADIEILQSNNGNAVATKSVPIDVRAWFYEPSDPGFHRLKIRFGQITYEECFWIGTTATADDLLNRAGQAVEFKGEKDNTENPTVNVNLKRLKVLLEPNNVRIGNKNWQLKFINAWYWSHPTEALCIRQSSIANISEGLHLRGMISDVDRLLTGYRIYIPSGTRDAKALLPVAIILPPPIDVPRPFIESPLVAEHLQAIAIASAAERLGIIVLWAGYRTMPEGSPAELAHVYEVLDDAARSAPIDTGRMVLIARCSAGDTVCQLLADAPNKFAAAAFVKAYFAHNEDAIENNMYKTCPDFSRWQEACRALNHYLNAQLNTQILVAHSESEHSNSNRGHGERDVSERFIQFAASRGVTVQCSMDGRYVDRDDSWYSLLSWCKQQPRVASPKPTGATFKRVSDLGPILAVFGSRFLIVRGDSDDKETARQIGRISRRIAQEWKRDNFADCPIKLDRDVTPEERDSSNLVLIGNEETNLVWQQLSAFMKVRISDNSVSLMDHVYEGPNLFVQAILPHPFSPERRVVIVGCARPKSLYFDNMALYRSGWYEYSIWRGSSQYSHLVIAGYYNSDNFKPARESR